MYKRQDLIYSATYAQSLWSYLQDANVYFLSNLNSFLRVDHVRVTEITHFDEPLDPVVQSYLHSDTLTRTFLSIKMIPDLSERTIVCDYSISCLYEPQ